MVPIQLTRRWHELPAGSPRLLAFRAICGGSAIVGTYVAAALGQARHAGWIAAAIGLPVGIMAALIPRAAPDTFLSCSQSLQSSAPARPRVAFSATGLLALLVLLPVVLTKLPAFDDYANYLSHAYIIMRHGHAPLLDQFYSVRWRVVPDLVLDLVMPPLASATGLYVSGKLFVVAYMLLLLTGPQALHAALYRRLSLGPLVAVPFLYNTISTWGALHYELGVGLALFGTAAWIAARRAPAMLRGVLLLASLLVLFTCHLAAAALYALAIGSYELWRTCSRSIPARQHAGDVLALALPFAALAALIVLTPTAGLPAMPWHWGGVHARLDALRYVVETYYPRLDLLALLTIAGGLVWAIAARALYLPALGWIFLALSGVVFLLTPDTTAGPWRAVPFLPVGVVFFLIGMLDWNLGSPQRRRNFLLAVVALSVFRMAGVATAFRSFDHIRADFERSLPLLTPGSRILVADDYANQPLDMAPLRGLACLAIIERSSMVSIEYANPYKHALVVRSQYRASTGAYDDEPIPLPLLLNPHAFDPQQESAWFAPSGRLYWANWVRDYDYVYVMNRANRPSPAPQRLELIFNGDRFQLFRVKHS